MGLGCLVEAGLFGDRILHRRSPDLLTFSPLFVLYRNHLHPCSSVLQEALVTGFRASQQAAVWRVGRPVRISGGRLGSLSAEIARLSAREGNSGNS